MKNFCFGLILCAAAVGCGEDKAIDSGEPCEEYVELLCDCADDVDMCDDLKTTYEDANAEIQDICSASMDEAEAASEACQEGGSEE